MPPGVEVRAHALTHAHGHEHGDFATYLRGPFREHANALLGPAASALDGAAHAVTIAGSVTDPPSLAHLQAVRAFVRKLARESGGIAAANLLALSWWDLAAVARTPPPPSLDASEWLEVLFDEDVRALYTRGMAQFARPDLALVGCAAEELEAGALLLRYVAELGAHGHLLRPGATVVLDEGEEGAGPRVDVGLTQLDAALRTSIGLGEDALQVEGFHEALANA